MTNIIHEKRINEIITFLNSLKIRSKRFSEIIRSTNISVIQNFNQALTNSSNNKITHETDIYLVDTFGEAKKFYNL